VQTGGVARLLLVLTLVAAAAGCGEGGPAGTGRAAPRTISVRIRELDGGFVLSVQSLRLTRAGWLVDATVENRTKATWIVGRPHSSTGAKFGLFVAPRPAEVTPAFLEAHLRTTPSLVAESFAPPLPRVFAPGASWAGRFGGRGAVPAGSYVSFAFGRFLTDSPPPGLPPRLLALTSRPVRIP
jgi:hypothetical protein